MTNVADSPILSLTMLGAGQEVGRSCCVLQYRGKTVVCDAGIHPAHSGMASLPFVDELNWSTVDAILITHFHLDHAAALTYITEKTNFKDGKGKVYMTHPTKAIYKFIMQDYVRMSSSLNDSLFTSLDLALSLQNIIPVSAHQLISPCPGLSFIPYHAGHVVGACMYMIDIVGLKVLYTGDYSREEDRHLVKAGVPPIRPDVLIVESTFGVQNLEARDVKEHRLVSLIHKIISRGGHVLLPVFAIGCAQELLLILDEYWRAHSELHDVPVYYASNLAKKGMAVYQTYVHTMNANIRARFARQDNPFIFKHISHLPQTRDWVRKVAEGPPCVVLASPAMLENGLSRELLELWAPDSRNGLIITGYSVEGTMARDIVNGPEEVISLKGIPIPRRLSVNYIPFSAHVDYAQNSEFIEQVNAQHIVLVHGEKTAMARLKGALQTRYSNRDDVEVHTPRNLETLKLNFRGERVAKALGKLAAKLPQQDSIISGLLISKDYTYTLLDPQDLPKFTSLSTCVVTRRQTIAIGVGCSLIQWHLEGMFGYVETGRDTDDRVVMRIMDTLVIRKLSPHELCLEWDSNASNDMIADATIALLLAIDSNPASIKKFHFGDVKLLTVDDSPWILVQVDGSEASINVSTLVVNSDHEVLKSRVESVLNMAVTTISSLSESYTSGERRLEICH
ncbi:endoribonuclease ysh1 [Clathrus columnatus]|uniref:Endoribonuclease YSH1 n=1 Tax=Clathrus columnatus TaxID=1419009 RepID=A0AAV5A269_9AGAM|nr:endoribonuclease ysh1 [Clathrus columnatus]